MRVRGFLQDEANGRTTAGEIQRVRNVVGGESFLGCFAYATQSGAAAFDMKLGQEFWDEVATKWLFGIDYGRTQPSALQFIADKPNTEVRVFDGTYVVNNSGFLPRRDFHMKSSFLINNAASRFGMVVGSGNFSSNGLARAVECGSALIAGTKAEFEKSFQAAYAAAVELWDASDPLDNVLEAYRDNWGGGPIPEPKEDGAEPDYASLDAFWIEAGYVTRNRGPARPGNQIDMPRGMNKYFGFHAPENQPVNSVIGQITFAPAHGDEVTRALRMGNNMMEKISLPIPETHGFDVYDGKVLVFQSDGGKFHMWALEAAEFEAAFAGRIDGVKIMGSGRRYGYIV